MSKRMLILFLCAWVVFCTACATESVTPQTLPPEATYQDPSGYVVNGVMEYPDYSFSNPPSTMELRLRAVAAFKDVLSVRWSVPGDLIYNKTGSLSEKTFHYDADTTYAGLFYSSASTGLFQFLEYYDYETGRICYPGDTEELKETLGASCADAMLWGLTTVCNSVTGPYYPACMVYKNGYLPVGNYTYDYDIESFNFLPTPQIIKNNGNAVMVDAYGKVKPGDMITSTTVNHAAMVISYPVVKYKGDGSIDLQKSYITVQDQRGGVGAEFFERTEGGETIRYSGCVSVDYTFSNLLKKGFLPVTTAEFAGKKPYEPCTVSIDKKNCKTIDQLRSASVSSNYPLAVVNLIAADQFGNQTVIGRQLFNGANRGGVPREFALSELECLTNFAGSQYDTPGYIIKLEVVPSTGQRFIVAEFSLE